MSLWTDTLDFFGLGDSGGDSFASGALDLFSEVLDSDLADSLLNFATDATLSGVDYYATKRAADAAMQSGKSAAEVLEGNAKLLFDEAGRVEQRTYDAIVRYRYDGLRLLSSQVAKYSASGVTMEGSPLLVVKETSDLVESELLRIQQQGRDTAQSYRDRGNIEKKKARNALDEGEFRAEAVVTEGILDVGKNILGL